MMFMWWTCRCAVTCKWSRNATETSLMIRRSSTWNRYVAGSPFNHSYAIVNGVCPLQVKMRLRKTVERRQDFLKSKNADVSPEAQELYRAIAKQLGVRQWAKTIWKVLLGFTNVPSFISVPWSVLARTEYTNLKRSYRLAAISCGQRCIQFGQRYFV